ncbi:MAG: N-acetylmuramoyl-L-alanine amidase [Oscillospiraceae bacterium]|nr:N-acetylmuramoyl-L-alanine amidase [Oscillospiraceae bacterium]
MSKFTNSPLVTSTRIHPTKKNGSGNFTRRIKKITIHHAAGVINSNNLLAWGFNPACGGSWNYGIGNCGAIHQMIDEKDRAWTSSSPVND